MEVIADRILVFYVSPAPPGPGPTHPDALRLCTPYKNVKMSTALCSSRPRDAPPRIGDQGLSRSPNLSRLLKLVCTISFSFLQSILQDNYIRAHARCIIHAVDRSKGKHTKGGSVGCRPCHTRCEHCVCLNKMLSMYGPSTHAQASTCGHRLQHQEPSMYSKCIRSWQGWGC